MNDAPPTGTAPQHYRLTFLADDWTWDRDMTADTAEAARTAAREALEELVKEEAPGLACVTLLEDGRKIGVWDWVERQAYWTRL